MGNPRHRDTQPQQETRSNLVDGGFSEKHSAGAVSGKWAFIRLSFSIFALAMLHCSCARRNYRWTVNACEPQSALVPMSQANTPKPADLLPRFSRSKEPFV